MSLEKSILIVAGNPASGKDNYAEHFVAKFGGQRIGMSTLISNYAAELSLKLTSRESFFKAHQQLRTERGMYALPEMILNLPEEVICISGLRVPAYQKYLHKHGAKTLALWASPSTRHIYASSDPTREPKSLKEFWLDEIPEYFSSNPFEISTVSVMNSAHYNVSIENKNLQQVAEEADRLVGGDFQPLLSPSVSVHQM